MVYKVDGNPQLDPRDWNMYSNILKPDIVIKGKIGVSIIDIAYPYDLHIESAYTDNNKKRSHTQLDSRKQVIAFQDRVITINIKEAQHPLKREK